MATYEVELNVYTASMDEMIVLIKIEAASSNRAADEALEILKGSMKDDADIRINGVNQIDE